MDIAKRNKELTILEAAEEHIIAGLTKMVSWYNCNKITVELRLAQVEDVIEDIASLKPWTMSWSNVLDYIDHSVFHDMAQKCSKYGDTIHFGYSMNWKSDVWGTSLIDYAGEQCTEARKNIIDISNSATQEIFKEFDLDKYFRLPLPQNPINTAAHALEVRQYKAWAEYFFSIARADGLSCHVANIERAFSSPLSRTGSSTVAFTWTYDPDIDFNLFHPSRTPV